MKKYELIAAIENLAEAANRAAKWSEMSDSVILGYDDADDATDLFCKYFVEFTRENLGSGVFHLIQTDAEFKARIVELLGDYAITTPELLLKPMTCDW